MKTLLQAVCASIALTLLVTGCGPAPEPRVVTLAGSEAGYAEGAGSAAKFSDALDVAVDAQGNIYVADSVNHRIRRVAPDGTVTTLAGSDQAGSTDGPLAEATFSIPTSVAVGPSGAVYVAESVARSPYPVHVRVIAEGKVTTLAGGNTEGYKDGAGRDALFRRPAALAVDQAGNVYVADTNNHRVRRISPEGEVTTLAGPTTPGYAAGYADGPTGEARFNSPHSVAVDKDGNVYVADAGNHCIRKITPDGIVTTLAGTNEPGYADGQGTAARFNYPRDVAVDAKGNVYVADTANHRIRKITPDGTVTTLAGSGTPGNADGPALQAQFRAPEGIAVDAGGNIIVADTGNYRIRKIVIR